MGNHWSRIGWVWALIASGMLGIGSPVWGADSPQSAPPLIRPRICVVLSGGGARGMAHIGVLEVLEELKIPIDCIAGTSMGAVVGGLYASGMSARDIDKTMRSVDWQEAFNDAPPRRDLAFRRKQDDRNFLVRLPLGLKHGHILLPKGLIQGEKLQETLRQLTLPFSNSTDFDRLPTPFRAVATDLENGDAVVLDKGDLAIAMRASISAPGVFAPVDYEGHLLVDGGLAENLPINVARAMNADILIVSDVSFPLQPRDQLDTAITISNQMLAILVRKDSDRQKSTLGPQDVLIEPMLGTSTATDFTGAYKIIVRGDEAARAMTAKLSALSVDEKTYARYVARREAHEPGRPIIRFVRVDPGSKRYERTIMAEMRPLIGKPLDLDAVGARITELYGLGNFETLDYSLVDKKSAPAKEPEARSSKADTASTGAGTGVGADTEPGAPASNDDDAGLEVRARRKSWGPNYVRFGLNLQDDFQGNTRYNAAARFLLSELNTLGAESLTDLQIGSDPRVFSEFYQPLDAARTWFVAPSARIELRDLQIYDKNSEVADYRSREVEADIDFGRNLGNWGEIRLGLHRTNGSARVRLGDPDLVESNYNEGELFAKFSYDQLDNVHFPRTGQTFSLQWDADRADLGADFVRDRVAADWLIAESLGRNTLLWWTSAGSTLDNSQARPPKSMPDLYLPEFYSLGGFLNLSGLAPQSVAGPNYAITRLVYFRKVSRGGEGFFEFPVYIGGSFEAGNAWSRPNEISFGATHKDESLFVAFDTYLGPVYLGGGYDQRGYSAFYLFLGRSF
jgi:NTE family protein